MPSEATSKTTERGTKRTCQNAECGARFYDLNRQPIVCPICNSVYALVLATSVRAYQVPAKRHVVEADRVEANAAADGDAHSQMEEDTAVGEDEDVLIEDIEEDSADVTEMIDAPTEPDEKP